MKKICLIKQSAGIGDIFFCQKIAYFFHHVGYKVIWPVADIVFEDIRKYMENDYVQFVSESSDFPYKEVYLKIQIYSEMIINPDFVFVPLQDHVLKDESVMLSKYKIAGIDQKDWIDYFNFKRNTEKEDELFYNILKISEGERYNLVNNMFATQPLVQRKNIQTGNELRNIELDILDGYTLFDWCKVVENAEHIFTAETCLNYIIEKIEVKAKTLNQI